MDESEMIMRCGHCGNQTVLKERAIYAYEVDHFLDFESDMKGNETTVWRILQCLVCSRPTFQEIYSQEEWCAGNQKVLYPTSGRNLNPLPEVISRAYEAVLRARYVDPNACAVLAGRALEVMCNYEKVQGRVLADKLRNLADSGRIPQTLAAIASQIKQLRHTSAHAATDEVRKEDVPIILEFIEAILEYLYVAPAKIANVQAITTVVT